MKTLSIWMYVFASLVIFFPAREAGFVMDWLGWEIRYLEGGWTDVPSSFGYKGLHPVLHFFNYLLYSTFGTGRYVWFILFVLLHGTNAWLIQEFGLRLLNTHADFARTSENSGAILQKKQEASGTVIFAALAFLVSPFAVEVVVWKVCLHYLFSLFFGLICLVSALEYLDYGEKARLRRAYIFFLLGLFSLEWSLVIPAMVAVLAFTFPRNRATKAWIHLVVPMFALIGAYFLLNKWTFGAWVGHYGAETHLAIKPLEQVQTAFRYVFKHFLFTRYWEHGTKEVFTEFLRKTPVSWVLTILLFVKIAIWTIFFHSKRLALRFKLAGIGVILGLLALLPVLNLYFYDLLWSENDRYGYMASGFFALAFVLAVPALGRRPFAYLGVAFLLISLFFQQKTVFAWRENEKVTQGLVEDFQWWDAQNVLFLGIPNNFKGTYMFRIVGQESCFQELLRLRLNRPFSGRMADAIQFNMMASNDAMRVEKIEKGENELPLYKLTFAQGGNWWWRGGVGASNYENDWYKVTLHEWHVEVQLLKQLPGTVVLYPVADRWVEVK